MLVVGIIIPKKKKKKSKQLLVESKVFIEKDYYVLNELNRKCIIKYNTMNGSNREGRITCWLLLLQGHAGVSDVRFTSKLFFFNDSDSPKHL